MHQALEQNAEAQEVLNTEMRSASRDDEEGVLRRQISPRDRDVLRAVVIVDEVGTIAPGPTDPAVSQAELVPEQGMEGVGYPEALDRFRRIRR